MAYVNVEFFSKALIRPVQFKMIIPGDTGFGMPPVSKIKRERMKTLFLLHGFSGAAGNWVPEYLTNEYNFAIVMPSTENGFWIDGISSGHNYGTFLTCELVEYVRKTFGLAMNAEETYIMGLSMGGFGALRAGLAYPDVFGKVVALSSALIIDKIANKEPGYSDEHANYEYYRECFGDLSKVKESINNPEVLVDNLISNGSQLPGIYMAVGTEDFLLEANRNFHLFLENKNVPHEYMESKGGHDMIFWDEYAKKLIPVIFAD